MACDEYLWLLEGYVFIVHENPRYRPAAHVLRAAKLSGLLPTSDFTPP
jgi:hypothetical protein